MGKLSRREFLSTMVIGATAIGSILQACNRNKTNLSLRSKIVRVTNSEATDRTGGKDNVNLNESAVREMVDIAVRKFTGQTTVEDAWKEIIPDSHKKVAIKVNWQITGIYTKAKVVKAVTGGLILRGVSPSNIIIYDMRDNAFSYAGFKKNTGTGTKVGTNRELGGYSWKSWFGTPIPRVGNRFCKVLTGEGEYGCDYLINIPVLKALDGYSGVSISMKNHFGSISAPNKLHSTIQDSIATLNAHELIVRKTRLILVDAIFTEYKWFNGRYQDTVDITNQLLIGTDPVAIDYVGWHMIEALRERYGLGPVQPKPDFIHKASSYGLGNDNLSRIDLIDI